MHRSHGFGHMNTNLMHPPEDVVRTFYGYAIGSAANYPHLMLCAPGSSPIPSPSPHSTDPRAVLCKHETMVGGDTCMRGCLSRNPGKFPYTSASHGRRSNLGYVGPWTGLCSSTEGMNF